MTLLSMRRAVIERESMLVELRAAQRSTSQERRRLDDMFRQAPSFMTMLRGPQHVFELTNPAYMRLVGNRDILGKSVAEALPDAAEQGFVDILDRVYRTGEPFSTKGYLYAVQSVPGGDSVDRYLDFVYQPTRDALGSIDGIFVEGYDVTDQVIEGKRREALAELGDRLRDQTDIALIVGFAAECLATGLGAHRTGFGSVSIDHETVVVQADWCAPGVVSIAGRHSFRAFGSYVESLKHGETVAIDDVVTDARTTDTAAAFAAISTRSLLNLPIMERNRLVLIVFAHQSEPHAWSDDELQFVQQIGDRTQAAIARASAEAQQRTLNQELSHRLKNSLSMVQAIATQTLRQATTMEEGRLAISQRLSALARAQDILTRTNFLEADVREVVEAAIDPHQTGEGRITIKGPPLDLTAQQALGLSLAIHELATNAAKYGALSNATGTVAMAWGREDGAFEFTWNEAGGPPVLTPRRRGFGSKLIERIVASYFDGEGRLDFDPSGIRFKLTGASDRPEPQA